MTPSRLNTHRLTVLLMALLLLLPAPTAWAQKTALEDVPLIVGVTELPPFSIKTDTGAWSGLGIDLWRMAAEEMETEFEIREFDWLKQISEALANNKIDVSCMLPVTEHNETVMDLSHAYHRT